MKQVQENLRRITMTINYTDDKGAPSQFQKYTYLHEESGYAGE